MKKPAYEQIQVNKDLQSISEEVLSYWKKAGIIEKSLTTSIGDKPFTFLEGPPTANGRPHVGHAMTRTVKDTVLRYRYMTGHAIHRRTGGWDCHGLPVEIEAEKHFGFKTKKEIEDFGIDKFNQYCRESIFRYIDEWMEADRKLGFWVDHEKAYVTLRNDYIESEWWALKTLFEKEMLIRDFKIVPYCPRCETSLSSHELSQGYDDVKDPSVYVKFREKGTSNRYFLAWTTTPWTLPSNEFIAVNENIEYAVVEFAGEEFYVANAVVGKLFGKDARVIRKLAGKELVGKLYEQLIAYIPAPDNTMQVVSGDHVNVEEGTGIVHTAPAFGAEDFEVGKRYGVDIINPVNQSGKFADPRLPWNGKFVKDADTEIIILLKKGGKIFKSDKVTHSYPFCYRCGTPLIYYPLQAWFIKVSTIRNLLKENNDRINWVPDHLKEGRFGNFLSEAKDWSLSRNRYWGTPLPVWTCENDHMKAVGSRDELKRLSGSVPDDLHRPFIDSITFPCPNCEKLMHREPYVIDTWFDSGSSTYAAMHYPFENKEADLNIPISFITEAIDQTRGWFYTLHVIGSLLFNKNAYANVLSIDHILDEQGRKMSKSKGNSVYALDFINEFGTDAIRLFFFTGIPWRSKAIDKKLITETSRKVFGTLANVYSFFASNANLDGFSYKGFSGSKNLLDKWIVSRTNSTIARSAESMDSYNIHVALRHIEDLIEDLSNFYLRLSRRRFWSETLTQEKENAYSTLFYVLNNIILLLAPIAPFFTEYLFLKLNPGSGSVHMQHYPVSDPALQNDVLEGQVKIASSILELVRRLRQENSVKGRQPVTEILIKSNEGLMTELLEAMSSELNARKIRFIQPEERPVRRRMKLVIQKAAPVLKSKTSGIKIAVEEDDGKLLSVFQENNSLELFGETLTDDFIEVLEDPVEKYAMATDSRLSLEVFLNTEIDEDLQLEGMAREIVRRIQVMRKEQSLQYDQEIDLSMWGDANLNRIVDSHGEWIRNETLARDISFEKNLSAREWDIDGDTIFISIQPVKR